MTAPASLRLDKWLWFARFCKSRSMAAGLCAAGEVSVNGMVVARAHQAVRTGDVVAVTLGPRRREVRVVALGARRGPAAEARLLYVDISA